MITDFQGKIISAQEQLEHARRELNAEITSYPTPIAGCDVQFNHMLAERHKVLGALAALSGAVFVPTPRSPTENAGVESR